MIALAVSLVALSSVSLSARAEEAPAVIPSQTVSIKNEEIQYAPAELSNMMVLVDQETTSYVSETGDLITEVCKVYQYPTRAEHKYYLEDTKTLSDNTGSYLSITLDADFVFDPTVKKASVPRYYSSYDIINSSRLVSNSSNGYLTDFETKYKVSRDGWTARTNAKIQTWYEVEKVNGDIIEPTMSLTKYF